MTVWLLVFVLFLKSGPIIVDHAYSNRFDCEVKEGVVATEAQKDKDVHGYVIAVPCNPIVRATKV